MMMAKEKEILDQLGLTTALRKIRLLESLIQEDSVHADQVAWSSRPFDLIYFGKAMSGLLSLSPSDSSGDSNRGGMWIRSLDSHHGKHVAKRLQIHN